MRDRVSAVADLLAPRVVVHIGASESGVYPADIYKSLAASPVKLYAVNPRRGEVFGHPCFSSVADIPERRPGEGKEDGADSPGSRMGDDHGDAQGKADLAVLTIPASAVPAALAECVAAGIPNALVISSGFAEAGAVGRALQDEMESLGDRINILGPNCAGFVNVPSGIVAARLYSRAAPGGLSFVSQSGALMMALHGAFAERGAGLRAVVSVGNQAGFRLSDFVAHFASDPGTKVVAAFIEGMPDGGAFVAAAKKCLAAGTPVVAIKSGRTDLGRKLAATHTAALAGEGRVFEAVCRQNGVILVDDIEDLVATSLVASVSSGASLDRIAWISQSGGLGSLAGDLAKSAGIEPFPFPEDLGGMLNPVDVGGDATRGLALRDTMRPLLSHPEIGAAVILFAKNPNRAVETETARSIIAARSEYGKPIVVVWVGPALPAPLPSPPAATPTAQTADESATACLPDGDFALRMLSQAGIPVFGSPGPAVRALSRLVAWRAFRNRWMAAGLAGVRLRGDHGAYPETEFQKAGPTTPTTPTTPTEPPKPPKPVGLHMLGHESGQALLGQFGIPLVKSMFVTADAGSRTGTDPSDMANGLALRTADAANGFLTPQSIAGDDSDSPHSYNRHGTHGPSVALKLLAPGFSHKSDAGLVALGLDSREAVLESALGMLSRLPDDCVPEGFLIQPMVRGGTEVFIGAQVDDQFGPVVAFGPGGIFVELLGGVDFLRPPFGKDEALLFVRRNAAYPILAGVRGAGPADLGTLADTLVGLGNLMLEKSPAIQSVDLNPFIIFEEGSGGFALDARIGEVPE